MTDEAAQSRGPSAGTAGNDPAEPGATPPPAEASSDEPTAPIGTAGTDTPPAGPPFGTAGPSFSREQLIRPRQGRYIAGVSGALARATNTDPVLWRVLLAVLGIMSGVGVLVYLIGWLIIPAEGDSASPIESLLGKGRSGMAPVSVVLLGGAAVLSFAFIVQDGMRAALLAGAVILSAVLLVKRGGSAGSGSFPGPATTAAAAPPPGFPATAPPPAPAAFAAPAGAAPAADPLTAPPPPPPSLNLPPLNLPPFAPPVPPTPPGYYRPPFAPHGPYARSTVTAPPPPPLACKPPKPPKERSRLGRLTFFAVVVVVGVLAAADMAGASVAVSAYFAAALATIALGLIVGAWFGRARGLIALALLTTVGLVVSTGTERYGDEVGNSVYRPDTLGAVADRYDFTAGNATLDLRGVDFTGKKQAITVTMKLGQLRVLVPPKVDTTAAVQLENGRAFVLGREFDGREIDDQSVTDLGADGTGGGTLTLDLQVDTGNVEVLR